MEVMGAPQCCDLQCSSIVIAFPKNDNFLIGASCTRALHLPRDHSTRHIIRSISFDTICNCPIKSHVYLNGQLFLFWQSVSLVVNARSFLGIPTHVSPHNSTLYSLWMEAPKPLKSPSLWGWSFQWSWQTAGWIQQALQHHLSNGHLSAKASSTTCPKALGESHVFREVMQEESFRAGRL